MWFDSQGIFRSVTKKNAALTRDVLKMSFDFIARQAPGRMICWIGDVTESSSPTKEARDYAAEETPRFVRALALITNSPLSKMIANIFLGLKKPPYPTRVFTNEKDTREWIARFL